MVFKATITQWSGLNKQLRVTTAAGTLFLLNSKNAQGFQTRASTKSSFLYWDNIGDHRESPSYIEAEESVATIKAAADRSVQSLLVPFVFYTDNDITLPTFARSINVDSIIYVTKDLKNPATKSWVCYLEGSKKRLLLCPYSIEQVDELIDAGDLTTD